MAWDEELRRLPQNVRGTFGEDVWEDAVTRALAVMSNAQPADADTPFAANDVCYEALKIELRRLLQPH
jgi:hypothetical protein